MGKIRRFLIPGALICMLLFVAAGSDDKYFQIVKNLDIFASLFKEVNGLYVDEVDPERVVRTGIDAMLESLDPYTTYIPEEDVDDFRSMTTGQYAGVGAMIGYVGEKIVITVPYDGFPADQAGLRRGDEILTVDGNSVSGLELYEISELMKGQPRTQVELKVKRYGHSDPLIFKFNREKIKISNVRYQGMINDNTGYINLQDFTTGAGREVADALKSLKKEGAENIIVDLRNNPGGLLNEAINVVNVFLPKDKLVVQTKGRVQEWNKEYKTLDNPVDTEIPLIVLVNGESASASEIVAGAIQDYDRGILIGRQTFGKGLVQTSRNLPYNTQIKITTARYYTPSGRCIQSIDYVNRDENGAGTEIPDSLKAVFYTNAGREVYDGEGLQPDILIDLKPIPPVIAVLISEGLLFDYVSAWTFMNPDKLFPKTEEEFSKFSRWISKQDYKYTTAVENVLSELKKSAEKEAYLVDLKDEIIHLEKTIEQDKSRDLEKFKIEIMEILEEEVAARRSALTSRIEATFDDDLDLAHALKLFNGKEKIDQILSRK